MLATRREAGPGRGDVPADRLGPVLAGGKAGLARALSAVEAAGGLARNADLLDEAVAAARGRVIGITGPPGVGKSTLIAALIRACRAGGETVAVLAVDPSSAFTGGALLGDRTRFRADPADAGVFVRSAAARTRLGGLSDGAVAAAVLMRAAFDVVIVETVGIGQSEADIDLIADVVVLCVQPGAGDTLQFMKAGIMELPDVFVVTKADLSREAARARHELEAAVGLSLARTGAGRGEAARPAIASASAADGAIAEVTEAIAAAVAGRSGPALASRRQRQQAAWIEDIVKAAFGRIGHRAWRTGHPPDAARPFAEAARAIAALSRRLEGPGGPTAPSAPIECPEERAR